jgi:hypothetical protein
MFSTKKGEKEEGSLKGFSSGYNIFILLFIASMLSLAIRGTLNGTYGKIWSFGNHSSAKHAFVQLSSMKLNNNSLIANADASCSQKRK